MLEVKIKASDSRSNSYCDKVYFITYEYTGADFARSTAMSYEDNFSKNEPTHLVRFTTTMEKDIAQLNSIEALRLYKYIIIKEHEYGLDSMINQISNWRDRLAGTLATSEDTVRYMKKNIKNNPDSILSLRYLKRQLRHMKTKKELDTHILQNYVSLYDDEGISINQTELDTLNSAIQILSRLKETMYRIELYVRRYHNTI